MNLPECPICFVIYHNDEDRKPRILNCGHTFCTKCLHNTREDNVINCPVCRKEFSLTSEQVSKLTVNFDQLKNGENFCFAHDCHNQIKDNMNGVFCAHCGFKLCHQCTPGHFEKRKKDCLVDAKKFKEKLDEWTANIVTIKSCANTDLDWIRIYRDKHLNEIKHMGKKDEIKKTLNEFCSRMNTIMNKIDQETKRIEEKKNIVNEAIQQVEVTSFESTDECFKKLDELRTSVNELRRYEPSEVDKEWVNISNGQYSVENPIVANLREWANYELNVAGANENFDPDKLIDMIRSDATRNKTEISIGVVGRSGVGKSSFLNAFLGRRPNDPDYIRVDYIEVVDGPRAYYVDKGNYPNFVLWDTPGVGTGSFSLDDFAQIIERINCHAFVYLFEMQFNELDLDVIRKIRKKTERVFICRTKVDNDYKRECEMQEKNSFRKLEKERRELYMSASSDEYKKTFGKLRHGYEEHRKFQNTYLNREPLIFYIANTDAFRHMFEFDTFVQHLLDSLPRFQSDLLLNEIRTRSVALLECKRRMIEAEIDNQVVYWIGMFRNKIEYKKWLNGMIQEFARRLSLNRLIKEIDSKNVDELIEQTERQLSVKLEAIRSGSSSDVGVSDCVDIGVGRSILFSLKNIGAKRALIEKTSQLLKQNLNNLHKEVSDIFTGYYMAKLEIDENSNTTLRV